MMPRVLHFPRPYSLAMPCDGSVIFYSEGGGPVTAMHWTRSQDSGFSLGDFDNHAQAMAAALAYKADLAASLGKAASA